ncbi:hypothetical protein [Allohahella marinimesophila]
MEEVVARSHDVTAAVERTASDASAMAEIAQDLETAVARFQL